MIWKLANRTKENNTDTEAVRPYNREEFATRCMLMDFANAAWLQSLDKKMDLFWVS